MSLESPLLSRVVRLLSSGTGDPRLPTFPLARSVPGHSGDTRPFAIVLQETVGRIDVGCSSVKILREIARISPVWRFARHPLTAPVITGFHGRTGGERGQRRVIPNVHAESSEFYRANRPPGGNWKLDYSGNNSMLVHRGTALLGIVGEIEKPRLRESVVPRIASVVADSTRVAHIDCICMHLLGYSLFPRCIV